MWLLSVQFSLEIYFIKIFSCFKMSIVSQHKQRNLISRRGCVVPIKVHKWADLSLLTFHQPHYGRKINVAGNEHCQFAY